MVLVIREEVVKKLLRMEDAIAAVEGAYRAFGLGEAVMTSRLNLWLNPQKSMKVGAAALMGLGYMGSFSYTGGFGKKGSNPSTTLLYDAKTGKVLASIESLHLKWYRTGATSAVAAKHLARRGANRVGVIGAGRQSRTQLLALSKVFDLTRVKVYSQTPAHRESYSEEMSHELGLQVTAEDDARTCVADADIVVCCSTSKEPVIMGSWLAPGTHVNEVGAHTPTTREVDTTTVERSKVVVEIREQALEENGNLLIPIKEGRFSAERIVADLGQIVAEKVKCRTAETDRTLFCSGGVALDQIGIAAKVYETALKAGEGQTI